MSKSNTHKAGFEIIYADKSRVFISFFLFFSLNISLPQRLLKMRCSRVCVDYLLDGNVFPRHVLHSACLSHHTQLLRDNNDDEDDDTGVVGDHTQLQADEDAAPHSEKARFVAVDEQQARQRG